MSWKSLFDAARPNEPLSPRDAKWWLGMRAAIEAAEPDIYWYPGSGEDLTPLVLDALPKNPFGQRLFPLSAPRQQRPLILWMNDYAEDYAEFPQRRSLGSYSSNKCGNASAQMWRSCAAASN